MSELLECRGSDLYGLGKALADSGATFRVEVRGLSMYPFLKDGDVVEVAPVQIGEVELGDVVFFRSGDRLLTHRVVEIVVDDRGTHLRTRGDSFRQEDPPISEADLVGLVTVVCRLRRKRDHTIRLDRGLTRWLGVLMARSRIVHRWIRRLVRVVKRGENVVKGLSMSGAERQMESEAVPGEKQRQ
jgi:signal peptidase I